MHIPKLSTETFYTIKYEIPIKHTQGILKMIQKHTVTFVAQ